MGGLNISSVGVIYFTSMDGEGADSITSTKVGNWERMYKWYEKEGWKN
jgi:hypothetical protein